MFRQSCLLILFSWVSLAPIHDAASANLATIRNRWNQREAHLSSISARWNSNTHVPASVRAEAANFFLGDSGPKYQYEAITYNESYALTLENTKARLDVISDALGDPSKPRKREESTMTYDGSTFVNLFHPRTRDGITAATTAKSNEMLKYQVLFPIFLYCRPSIAISASLSELTEGIATEAKNGRDCTKLTLRRSGERTETIIWVTTDSACLPVQVSRLDIATGHALHEFVMKYRLDDSKNTFLSSWSFTDHTTGEPSTTASDLVSFTIVKPPIDESKFSTELPQGTVVVDRESTQRYVVRGKNRSDVLKPEVLHGRSLRTVVTGSKWLSVLSLVVVLSVLMSIGFGYSQWKRR